MNRIASVLFTAALAIAPAHADAPLIGTQLAELDSGLSRPHDAAFSADGRRIYLTDMANSEIAVLDSGSLRELGRFGSGELSFPHDAEFDARGHLLVADTGNGRIAIYQPEGTGARLIGELGGLAAPEGVAVMPDGRVVATNTRTGMLSVFRDGVLERTIGNYGQADAQFSRPHDVDVAADGRVYVVDSGNHRVQVFDADFRHLASVGAELGLNEPKYLALDGDDLWLADEYNHRILLLDRELRLRAVLGSGERGRSANEYHKPEAVMARKPLVWVIDTYNDRIVRLRLEPGQPEQR